MRSYSCEERGFGMQIACFFFSSRRRHTRWNCDWNSDVCSSDLVDGADLIEAHFIDEALEDERIFGEEVDAPFPIVEPDGARDDLAHVARVPAADHAVLVHHLFAVCHRFLVP